MYICVAMDHNYDLGIITAFLMTLMAHQNISIRSLFRFQIDLLIFFGALYVSYNMNGHIYRLEDSLLLDFT